MNNEKVAACHPSVGAETHEMLYALTKKGEAWFYCETCFAYTWAPSYEELLDTELHYNHEEGEGGIMQVRIQEEWDDGDGRDEKMVAALRNYKAAKERNRGKNVSAFLEI